MANKKITMQMIADVAGYSKYVVSKTLNGKEGVSEATRQKIYLTAKQLGYFKDHPIKQIETAKENKQISKVAVEDGFVLVVMPNHRYQNTESYYWSNIFNGIIEALDELKIGAMVISSQNNLAVHVKNDNLLGIITVGLVSTEMLLELNKHNVTFVMIDHEDPLLKVDTVFMNNIDSMYKLTNHLMGLGHERLVFVGDHSFSRSFYDRWQGFRMALEERGLYHSAETNLLGVNYSAWSKSEKALESSLVSRREKESLPTAFICANDEIAARIISLLTKMGLSIPKDCSVTGFDNLAYTASLSPPLATVQVLKEAMGRRAVSMLLWRMENFEFPFEKILISGDMLIRESISTPPE